MLLLFYDFILHDLKKSVQLIITYPMAGSLLVATLAILADNIMEAIEKYMKRRILGMVD
jgi:ABC-type proline/glycine betaine transport system permease subunit